MATQESRKLAPASISLRKLLWFDTETTGLAPGCDIIQMAGLVEIDGKVVHEFNINVRPFPDTVIEDSALEMLKKTREQIAAYPSPQDALVYLESVLGKYVDKFNKGDKFVLGGHNVGFDLDKLVQFYKRCGNDYLGSWFHFRYKLDTLAIVQALQVAGVMPPQPSNKLVDIANTMKVPLPDAHDALFDIKATREIGVRLIRYLQRLHEAKGK